MKKTILLTLIVSILFNLSTFAKKLASLPEVQRPYKIAIKNNKLIISDSSVLFHMYSMEDFSYKLLSKKGEGPSESKYSLDFAIYKDWIYAFSYPKGMWFKYDGSLLKELRIPLNSVKKAFPLGKNFVFQNFGRPKKYTQTIMEISIYKPNKQKKFDYKKMFYYFIHESEKSNGKPKYPLIKNYFGFIIEDDKVFVGDSYRGFSVEIFDSEGKEVGKVRLYPEQIKIPDSYITESLKKLEKDPGYQAFKKMRYPYFPEYYPDFYRFDVEDGKVYFLTYKKLDDKREVIVTDYNGKILKRGTVPWIENYWVHMNFAIVNDKYYYLKENEDTEEWELHVEDIK